MLLIFIATRSSLFSWSCTWQPQLGYFRFDGAMVKEALHLLQVLHYLLLPLLSQITWLAATFSLDADGCSVVVYRKHGVVVG